MLTRAASTSFWTTGSMALFWRGRLTGWSITYWKKSPSFAAEAMLDTPGTVFIAVGAAHLAGPDSVQAQLQKLGVSSTRVPAM